MEPVLSPKNPNPIWRVKYRPKTLEDIKSLYPKIYAQFKGYINSNNIPHLMLVGPPGSGKTVLAEILARELLKSEFDLNYRLLFANDPISQDERKETRKQGYVSTQMVGSSAGIQRRYRPFIQMRVRPFVSMRKFGESPFKILSIENFHDLDVEQQAFRRIMEFYSKNCRMILITDKISGIIDPIVSRCQLIMVPYVAPHIFNKTVKKICDLEEIPIKLDIINYLYSLSEKSLGKALDLLQITFNQFNFITLEYLSKLSHEIQEKLIKQLFTQTLNGNLTGIRKTLRDIFRNQKKSKDEILLDLMRILSKLPLERAVRAKYLDLIAECDFSSIDSNNDEIQLMNLFAKMVNIAKMVS